MLPILEVSKNVSKLMLTAKSLHVLIDSVSFLWLRQ